MKETLNNVQSNDFVYLDPPYAGKHTDYFNKWTDEDSSDLAEIAQQLESGYALSMWADNAYRENEYLHQWNGEVITQAHFIM